MRRPEFVIALGGAAMWPLAGEGQQAAPLMGILGFGSLKVVRAGFAPVQRRLAEMGYVEGQNLAIEYRCADSHEDRLKELAADQVQRRVHVIYAPTGASTVAARPPPLLFQSSSLLALTPSLVDLWQA